ncbi:hypothetical protein PG997_007026 [Apiospora hydei]|uniref:Uncharacterized protein n=1 Tax=Apiospora hydei TaxID=1337664 RepID=A0ABR1WQE4_9PEZI
MSGQPLYMTANPGQQQYQPLDNKSSPNAQRGQSPAPLMRGLTIVSALLFLASLAALAFKSLSTAAWQTELGGDAASSASWKMLMLLPAADGTWDPDGSGAVWIYPQSVARFDNYAGTLTWVAIVVGLTLAAGTGWCAWRVARKGPYYYSKNNRVFTYLLYHLYYLYPLAVFVVLTVAHAQSAHLPAKITSRADSEAGLYVLDDGRSVFDLETLACEAQRLAHNSGGAGDRAEVGSLARVCVGEMASRGLVMVIAALSAGLAMCLETDRRGARRFIAVAEKVRNGLDARGGYISP